MSATAAPTILISAGEVSGDIVAARLIDAIREQCPSAIIHGLGGPRMVSAGATLIAATDTLGVVGLSEGIATLPAVFRVLRQVARHVEISRPDVAVLIGNDGFNYLLARRLRRHGVKTIAFFPPQSWLWRSLARLLSRPLDLVLASFPHEERTYRDAGARTMFVGHYLADVLTPTTEAERHAARQTLGLAHDAPVVGILPGSREAELTRLSSVLLAAADVVSTRVPRAQLVMATAGGANDLTPRSHATPSGRAIVTTRDSHTAMRAADVLLCCSGTATLEAALLGTPLVLAYKVSRITYVAVYLCIALRLIDADTIGLPNLILGRPLVPEFKQQHAEPQAIGEAAAALIPDDGPRRQMRAGFVDVRAEIERRGTIASVASIVLGHTRRV